VAFNILEFRESRRVTLAKDTESADLVFVAFTQLDDSLVRPAVQAALPASFTPFSNALPLLTFDINPRGGGFWRVDAHYGPDTAPLFPAVGIAGPPTPVAAAPGPNTPLGPDFSFDFEGVTEKITQSKETISKTKRGAGVAPDNKGAIGITADGTVEGCERVSPNLVWSRTVTFASATTEYIDLIASLVGSTNDATFYNKPAKSQIFLGGNAQTDDTFKTKVTLKFLSRPNLTLIDICDGLQVPAKNGSEYLWVSYKRVETENKLFKQPDSAYVERICDVADWSQLRIGV
jgi:hypothetical protein